MPDLADQIGPGEHPGRVRGEEGQQLELLEGQLDLVPVGPDTALPVVQALPGGGTCSSQGRAGAASACSRPGSDEDGPLSSLGPAAESPEGMGL